MARLTTLGTADVDRLAEGFGLGPVRGFAPIDAGTVNSNFAVTCASGRYFLRVNEGKEEDDVAYEARLVEELAELGVDTPRPLRAGETPYLRHGDKWISVFPWVDGRHLEAREVGAEAVSEVGRALARLHEAGDRITDLPDRYGIYTTDAIRVRARGFAGSPDPRLAEVNRLIAAETEWLVREGPAPDPAGIIHGDLFRDNVLFSADGSAVVALLDFEQASLGSRLYDLAVCVNAWCWSPDTPAGRGGFDAERVAAMVGSYQAVRGAVDVAALWRELRRAAWRFTVTRVTDVYLRGVDDPGKRFEGFQGRLLAWRDLGPTRLAGWLAGGSGAPPAG